MVEERTADAYRTGAETAPVNRLEEGTDHQIGIITASTSYQYVKEACGDRYPVLKLGMTWPLPERNDSRLCRQRWNSWWWWRSWMASLRSTAANLGLASRGEGALLLH